MSQSNIFSHGGQKYLLLPRGAIAIEVPQNEKTSGEGVGSAIRRRANRGSINIKKARKSY